jgi:hypothetical protein
MGLGGGRRFSLVFFVVVSRGGTGGEGAGGGIKGPKIVKDHNVQWWWEAIAERIRCAVGS